MEHKQTQTKKRKNKRSIEPSLDSSPSDSEYSSFSGGISTSQNQKFQINLNLRVTNESFLLKWQIMSITDLYVLFLNV